MKKIIDLILKNKKKIIILVCCVVIVIIAVCLIFGIDGIYKYIAGIVGSILGISTIALKKQLNDRKIKEQQEINKIKEVDNEISKINNTSDDIVNHVTKRGRKKDS